MPIGIRWLSRTRLVMAGGALGALALTAWLLAPARPSSAAAQHTEPAAIAVDAASATLRDVPIYLEGLGTVQAFYTVKLTARVDGEITKIAFTEGDHVKRGQLLVQIDPRPYQAALDGAIAARAKDTAQLANANEDLARYVLLAPKKLTSKQTLDTQRALVAQLKAQIESDDAAIESARTQLSYTRITSPIDGRTGIRLIDPGNIVHAADTAGIVVITQLQPITVIVTLPENSLGAVATALARGPVSVSASPRDTEQAALAGAAQVVDQGTVQLIDNQIDQSTGTLRLKAIFANKQERLWPGEFVNAHVLVRTVHDALTIPAVALQRGPNGLYAYVIGPDSKVEARPLKVGYNDEQVAVIEGGLQAGERVATSNFYRLQPGALVHINRSAELGAAEQAAGSASAPPRGNT
ncbi:MAG: efflux RND transporter periplasmic adaptor subunit [Steroidobacteraceae bacterium]